MLLGTLGGGAAALALQRLPRPAAVLAYDAVVLLAAVLVGVVLARRLSGGSPPRRRRTRARSRARTDVRLLNEWEDVVASAVHSMAGADGRLRPRLRALAADRLALRGIDLDEEPERARAVLGEDAWQWLRPDRPPAHDRRAPGPSPDHWAAVVAAVEQAGRR